ncbi:MAG: hypothetical protein PHV49_06790, partial [Alistipes sp.]|nr:hypothetical protein [Alistipes sp.]
MKYLALITLLFCSSTLWGQHRIIDPVKTDYSSVITFDRIEITPQYTEAEVTLRYVPHMWVQYDSLT